LTIAAVRPGSSANSSRSRAGLGRKQLQDIGARMIELRKTAPRKPSQPGALKKVIDAIVA